MPLKRGSSRKTINENISREMYSGRSLKQAIAVAYSEARRTAKSLATHIGKGWHAKLIHLGKHYEVEFKRVGKPLKHRAFKSLEAAKKYFHSLIREHS